MRRWLFGAYADHTNRTRREESPRRFSCSADCAHSAARGPLQTAAAAQHRHGAGGQRSASSVERENRPKWRIEPERSERVARDGAAPAWRAGDSRDKRFVPSTRWGCPATGPALGVEAAQSRGACPDTLSRTVRPSNERGIVLLARALSTGSRPAALGLRARLAVTSARRRSARRSAAPSNPSAADRWRAGRGDESCRAEIPTRSRRPARS